jgi:hypothetical protein
MKRVIIILLAASGMLFGEWESAYGYGSSIARPNPAVDYAREFKKSAGDGNFYDESMKNRFAPKMVEEEDRMVKPAERSPMNYKKNTDNFFYSSSGRDYYRNDIKNHNKFPTTDY